MANYSGFVQAAAQLGLTNILIKPQKRGLYDIKLSSGTSMPDIIAQATIEEHHRDTLEVTEHPVQQGARIADHAFKRPAELTLKLGWSNSPPSANANANLAAAVLIAVNPAAQQAVGAVALASGLQSAVNGAGVDQVSAIYAMLLRLQSERALFTIYTGKRKYLNMICETLATESDFRSNAALPISMSCKQVIIVNTQVVSLPAATQATPSLTAAPVNRGTQSAIATRTAPAVTN